MRTKILNFTMICFIYGSLKDALLAQFLLFSCCSLVTMAAHNPVFNPSPVNLTYYVGETATLKCSVGDLGPSKVIWKREDQEHVLTVGKFVFVSDPHYSIKHIPYKDEWNLIIEDVKPRHAGFYECQISTKTDMKRYVQLNVIDEPSHDLRYINITGKHRCAKGQPVKLTCNVSAFRSTPSLIRWFINDTLIRSRLNVKIINYQRSDVFSFFSELDINKCDTYNNGYYTCKAVFNNGLKTAKHFLFVDTYNVDGKQSKRGTIPDDTQSPDFKGKNKQRYNSASIDILSPLLLICSVLVAKWC